MAIFGNTMYLWGGEGGRRERRKGEEEGRKGKGREEGRKVREERRKIIIKYNNHHSTRKYHEFVAVCIVMSAQHE